MKNFKQKSVNVHQFAMVPRNDIPRAGFRMQKGLKTAFDSGYLVPIYCEEALPGDTFRVNLTAFCRLATPLFPFMDNLWLETFFFFVPNRLVWDNWVKFMGEQTNPADSISFTIPQCTAPSGGWTIGSIGDYFGLPTVGQYTPATALSHSVLPLRAYNLIWNQWFRDENLQNSLTVNKTDGPDANTLFTLKRRGKRHDYFTSCLPWTQKGATQITVPLAGTAPVIPTGDRQPLFKQDGVSSRGVLSKTVGTTDIKMSGANFGIVGAPMYWSDTDSETKLVANLAAASGATINALRLSIQTQKFLEHDARGGTRYTELILEHFGVRSPDARLQRPEYLGGGKSPIIVNPIPQTSATSITGGATPQGNLAAMATSVVQGHGFSQSFTEHGYIIGLAQVNADLTYQQGMRRHWSRSTRYDYYWPVFAALGEQAVLNKEIYCKGDANDALVFGYQERWAEYRYNPSEITGLMRSTAAANIDAWHLAQEFGSLPTLSDTFIQDTPPVDRVVAVGSGANGQQLLFDGFFDCKVVRPMPLYSVPGLMDHF